MSRERERMIRGLHDAHEPQPWRCHVCREAVRPGRGDPCACIPEIDGRVYVPRAFSWAKVV